MESIRNPVSKKKPKKQKLANTGTGKMAQQHKVPARLDDLSLTPRTHMMEEEVLAPGLGGALGSGLWAPSQTLHPMGQLTASPLGLSRKRGHQHLELPSPSPQDVDSCAPCLPRLPLPHLLSEAISCSEGGPIQSGGGDGDMGVAPGDVRLLSRVAEAPFVSQVLWSSSLVSLLCFEIRSHVPLVGL